MIDILNKNNLLLASKSPRRSELLRNAGIPFTIIKCDWDEDYDEDMDVTKVPQFLSYHKALHVRDELNQNDIILTADTVVIKDGKLLGKPKNRKEALETIENLSNTSHQVITGITVMSTDKTVNASSTSDVHFDPLSNAEIESYVDECKPYDKAGSYGIQDWIGICKIKSISGSYHNIMGLPTHMVYAILKAW